MSDPTTTRRPGLRLAGVVGVAISLFFLWWTLKDVAFAEVITQMREVRVLPFLGMIALATLTFPIRTIRWRYLLRADGEVLPFTPLWHATAVGFMLNNLMPARPGELARPFIAQRLTKARFTSALASIGVERLMDSLVLVALLVVATWAGGFAADTTVAGFTVSGLARFVGIVAVVALAFSIVLVNWPDPAKRIADATARAVLPDRWAARAVSIIDGLLEGLDSLRSAHRFTNVLLWSVILWLVNAYSFYVGFAAFGIEASWSAALMLQSVIAFGIALPSAPGFFGVFEFFTKSALALYAIDATHAVAYALGYHLGTFLPITLLGIWSLLKIQVGLREMIDGNRDTQGATHASPE